MELDMTSLISDIIRWTGTNGTEPRGPILMNHNENLL